MAVRDRVRRGALDSIFARPSTTITAKQHLAEMVLMTALADGFIEDAELGRVIRTIASYGELRGLGAEWLVRRARELRENAPLFSEAREELVRDLVDAKTRRLGVALAAKLVSSERPLQEEEKAVLHGLADAFRIDDDERPILFAPWHPHGRVGVDPAFAHSDFNDPNRTERIAFFDALRTAEDDEFRRLTQKVVTTRALISRRFESADVVAVGEAVEVGPWELRLDAVVEHASVDDTIPGFQLFILRCLAPGEALHPLEHAALATLALRLDDGARILVVAAGDLSLPDKVFLQTVAPTGLPIELVALSS